VVARRRTFVLNPGSPSEDCGRVEPANGSSNTDYIYKRYSSAIYLTDRLGKVGS
jgi:hypothetical protein